ncbi:MAG TPA: HNH endonuclease domain-containing protein, partial [Chryseosolibacter sp.]|nr:HNH endonuclease domain-containing protein [Chryseosolibacter sp.]
FLIETFGTFSIPLEYYEVFRTLGSFINGQDALLFKWAQFSVNASGKALSIEKVINEVLKSPVTERDILRSKKLYVSILKQKGNVRCVWTGRKVTTYDIDHVIPFAIWKNNDLWNLLPAQVSINNLKRAKIPSPELIQRSRELITEYWHRIDDFEPERFRKEIQVTLLGGNSFAAWEAQAIGQLQSTCEHLIAVRGFQPWNGK